MFTGLIDHTGTIKKVVKLDTGLRIRIESNFNDLSEGESIAVDGACLSAIHINQNQFEFELSEETLDLTIAKNYFVGSAINLERALKLNDRLGGHFVSGHVDQIAVVKSITQQDDFFHYIISGIEDKNQQYLIPKGSITVNGVSLTINKIINNECHLMLIPHTLERTNLSDLAPGSHVNIELDLLAKIVAKQTRGLAHEPTL